MPQMIGQPGVAPGIYTAEYSQPPHLKTKPVRERKRKPPAAEEPSSTSVDPEKPSVPYVELIAMVSCKPVGSLFRSKYFL